MSQICLRKVIFRLLLRSVFRLLHLLVVALVSLDNALHEIVANDIPFFKFYLADAFHIVEHTQSLHKTRLHGARQVDLSNIAGNNHFGAHTQTGEEHLDLVGCGVLRLIEDYHGIVEGATAHKRERSNLYSVPLHHLLEFCHGNHILEGIVERL